MQMKALRAAGADGFVIGCLTAEGNLDGNAMAPLLRSADALGLTLHRCIDVSRDPCKTYMDAKELGIDTVLTSGGIPIRIGVSFSPSEENSETMARVSFNSASAL